MVWPVQAMLLLLLHGIEVRPSRVLRCANGRKLLGDLEMLASEGRQIGPLT